MDRHRAMPRPHRGSAWLTGAALLVGVVAVVAACGTSTTSPSGGAPASIQYSIWGDPAELASQQAIVDAFHAANPDVTVNVTVSDWNEFWTKLETGLAGGAAADVFAMDGPLFPDYQVRDVLLDLKPYIDKEKYDLTKLADQGVADFTTTGGGQYGLPRDLNTVVLYYNKAMFDAAGLPYPDDTWDWAKLVEVGKKLTLDTNGDGTTDQWGLYTETGDMENAWLSFVWQNGGDVLAPDGKTTVVDSPQAAGGIQFLQDLIYKDKIVPEPSVFAATGDAFEQGLAAMEINGSWLVPTHTAAGIDFGIAPIPSGPAGRFTSVNPTGAVVNKGTKSPDAAWRFVKYLASPEAQTKLMELHASLPVSKEVLSGAYSTSFDGAKVLADSLTYAKLKPSFAGYNEFNTMLQGELDTNVFLAPNKTAQDAVTGVTPALNEFLSSR
jgi:multiple sugar transport system substrate-binding protein